MAGYTSALRYAQSSGRVGRIVPSGSGRNINYSFVPTGGVYGGSGLHMGGNQPEDLVSMYQRLAGEATAANKARETEIRGIYTDILNSISGSNSSLRASGLRDIENQANRLVGQETQNLISSGLYGTTTAASIPTRVQTEFAQPARVKLEDLLTTRKREAQLGLAGFVERIQNAYPDYNALLQAEIAKNQ